jgi:hypothetical protein
MGLEKEAVEFCEKAVRLGLKEENLKRCIRLFRQHLPRFR